MAFSHPDQRSGLANPRAAFDWQRKMIGLTPLGSLPTAVSLIAVTAVLVGPIRDRRISPKNLTGKIYLAGMVVTC
jgi:hypothetical protein